MYIYLVTVSLVYQVSWKTVQEKRFEARQEMEQNGDGDCAKTILDEVEYFPVCEDPDDEVTCQFEDGYGGERNYGGKRRHEGIDVMASRDEPACLLIRSVSDGVVEQIGWLKLGGYRIGIRSDSGMYYYYAHLDHYAEGIRKGTRVRAGDVIGAMGDTGYGPEGTRGKFAVHLHFGIYCPRNGQDCSINPYPVLQFLK